MGSSLLSRPSTHNSRHIGLTMAKVGDDGLFRRFYNLGYNSKMFHDVD